MWSSPLFWIAVSITVFWALGAYNRLMRLRSAVAQTFGAFDAHMQRLIALLGEVAVVRPTEPGPNGGLAALEGATVQLSASLAVARARPLDVDALAALASARQVLDACWASTMNVPDAASNGAPPQPDRTSEDLLHESVPENASGATSPSRHGRAGVLVPLQIRWDENTAHANQAIQAFNDAVAQYNDAVAQFPASLLARLFGFRAARGL